MFDCWCTLCVEIRLNFICLLDLCARNTSAILTSFNTILIPCLLVLFSPDVLHTPLGGRNSVKLNLVGSGLKSKFGVNP